MHKSYKRRMLSHLKIILHNASDASKLLGLGICCKCKLKCSFKYSDWEYNHTILFTYSVWVFKSAGLWQLVLKVKKRQQWLTGHPTVCVTVVENNSKFSTGHIMLMVCLFRRSINQHKAKVLLVAGTNSSLMLVFMWHSSLQVLLTFSHSVPAIFSESWSTTSVFPVTVADVNLFFCYSVQFPFFFSC